MTKLDDDRHLFARDDTITKATIDLIALVNEQYRLWAISTPECGRLQRVAFRICQSRGHTTPDMVVMGRRGNITAVCAELPVLDIPLQPAWAVFLTEAEIAIKAEGYDRTQFDKEDAA